MKTHFLLLTDWLGNFNTSDQIVIKLRKQQLFPRNFPVYFIEFLISLLISIYPINRVKCVRYSSELIRIQKKNSKENAMYLHGLISISKVNIWYSVESFNVTKEFEYYVLHYE